MHMHSAPAVTEMSALFGREIFSHGPKSPSTRRGKAIYAGSPFPLWSTGRPSALNTQLEIAGGLIFTLRLGFNPGELLDFILGFSGIDIWHDDLPTPDPADASSRHFAVP